MGQTCSGPRSTAVIPALTADALESLEIISQKTHWKDHSKQRSRNPISGKTTLTSSDLSNAPLPLPLEIASTKETSTALETNTDAAISETAVHPTAKPTAQPAAAPSLFSTVIWSCQKLCAEDPILRKEFVTFIRGLTWVEKITNDIRDHVVTGRRRSFDHQEITFNEYSVRSRSTNDSKEMETVAQTMMRCTQLKIRDTMIPPSPSKDRGETCFTFDQLKLVLLATLWPLFLESEAYKNLTNAGAAAAAEEKNKDDASSDSESEDDVTRNHQHPLREQEKIQHLRSIYVQVARATSVVDFSTLLERGQWVQQLQDSIERLPFPVSIRRRNPSSGISVLVFVNAAYETCMLYPRADILGQSESFLICSASEQGQLSKINEALSKAEGIKIAITNARRDGSTFLNFLAVRPVLARADGEYTHVISAHYDVGKSEASLREMKLIGEFLSLMGNILKG